jgi:trans-aconitate 2-methyltransferase
MKAQLGAHMAWSAQQYLAFEDERTRPVRDLVNAIPRADAGRVIDIGCGPGNSTEVLAARFPHAAISGLDNSADMLAAARKRLPDCRFENADVDKWQAGESYDVILSNAVFQWVPDHAALFPRLMDSLAPGGHLAVQMPDNFAEPAQVLMRQTATQGPWAQKFAPGAVERLKREDATWYYGLLRPRCAMLDIWRTTYFHRLAGGADAIVEWFKGSSLQPFLVALDESERVEFLARYRDAVARAHPPLPDGAVLLPFPRLFIVATR